MASPDSIATSPLDVVHSPELNSSPLPAPYTTITSRQRHVLTYILGFSMLASPLTATIYFPLLPVLATQFHVSLQAIDLTITVYLIFQAISPALFATLSDSLGRRPISLATYLLYTLSSLGLALNRSSYTALLILRALQSLGASAGMAIAYGVVSDVCVPSERGSMIGPLIGAGNLAVVVGPIVGGWVVFGSGNFEWVFWSLVIFGGFNLGAIGWGLRETARNVVGNGSVDSRGWSRTWWSVMAKRRRAMGVEDGRDKPSNGRCDDDAGAGNKKIFKIVNPFTCLRIIFWKDTAAVLWMAASPYAVYYCIQTSIPSIYRDLYGFNELQVGLAYLTGGLGVIIGGYANGKFMDWNYKTTAKSIGYTIDKFSGDDLSHFPIERARSRGSWFIVIAYGCALAGYGWVVEAHVHESVPMILQFVLAVICTSFQQTYNCLLVDIFPENPSTAAASASITRCALSALAVAILPFLVHVMGRGWFFMCLTLFSGGGSALSLWAIQAKGMQWRGQRLSATQTEQRTDGDRDIRTIRTPDRHEKASEKTA